MVRDERIECGRKRIGRSLVCLHDPRCALVCFLYFIEPCRNTKGHSPDVLDESEPKHRRYRPQLAELELRHTLVLAHEEGHVLERDMTFGVGYQLDRELVDAWVVGKRSVGELRKLLVITSRKVRPDFPDVLLDDVVIVEQPLARRAYDIGFPFRGDCKPPVDVGEHDARVIEPLEKGPRSTLFGKREKLVLARDVARMLRQPVRAEYFAADRTNELSVLVSGTTEEAKKAASIFFGRNYSRHVLPDVR